MLSGRLIPSDGTIRLTMAMVIAGAIIFTTGWGLMEMNEAPVYRSVFLSGHHVEDVKEGGSLGWEVGNFMTLIGMTVICIGAIMGVYCLIRAMVERNERHGGPPYR
jgi:cytochrome bd-type quinol oxidase subunit 1